MATVRILNHLGAESRIDLGREKPTDPKADPGAGRHRGHLDLASGPTDVDEKLWEQALRNPLVKSRLGSRHPKTGLPNGYEQVA